MVQAEAAAVPAPTPRAVHPTRPVRAVTLLAALAATASCGFGEPAGPPPVDPTRAFSYLRTQTAFGPRVAGLPGHARQAAWLRRELAFRADTLLERRIPFVGARETPTELVSLLARFNPAASRRVLLVAGWDTPPRVPGAEISGYSSGANDAASGVAVLMELAELFRQRRPEVGVDLLFADGTDQGLTPDRRLLGVRRFVAEWPAPRPAYAIVLGGVGDRDLALPREGRSLAAAGEEVERIWERARELELPHVFLNVRGDSVDGAHRVLHDAGIRAVLVADPEYGPGNRFARSPLDLPRNVSPESVGAVARVLAEVVYAERAE